MKNKLKVSTLLNFLYIHKVGTVLAIFTLYLTLVILTLYLDSTLFGVSIALLIHAILGFALGIFSEWCQAYDEANSGVYLEVPNGIGGGLELIATALVIIFSTCIGPVLLTTLMLWVVIRSRSPRE